MVKVLLYIKDGLSQDEAVRLAGFSFDEFERLLDDDPDYSDLVELESVSYKHKLIKSVSLKAADDSKTAMWLLENRYDDFGKRRKAEGPPTNQLAIIINQIQQSNPVSASIPIPLREIREAITQTENGGPSHF